MASQALTRNDFKLCTDWIVCESGETKLIRDQSTGKYYEYIHEEDASQVACMLCLAGWTVNVPKSGWMMLKRGWRILSCAPFRQGPDEFLSASTRKEGGETPLVTTGDRTLRLAKEVGLCVATPFTCLAMHTSLFAANCAPRCGVKLYRSLERLQYDGGGSLSRFFQEVDPPSDGDAPKPQEMERH